MSINSFRNEVESLSDDKVYFDDTEKRNYREYGFNHNVKNALTGTVGAFLFALGGGILWFLVYQSGFIVGAAGVAAVLLAIYGYSLFGNGMSKYGFAISVVFAVVVIFLAEYCCAAKDIYDTFKLWYSTGESDYSLTFFQSLRNVTALLTEEGKRSYGADLAIGYFLSIVSGALYFVKRRKVYSVA